jgi:hypothetical protein
MLIEDDRRSRLPQRASEFRSRPGGYRCERQAALRLVTVEIVLLDSHLRGELRDRGGCPGRVALSAFSLAGPFPPPPPPPRLERSFGRPTERLPKPVSVQLVGGHNSASSNVGVWSALRRRRSMRRGVRL